MHVAPPVVPPSYPCPHWDAPANQPERHEVKVDDLCSAIDSQRHFDTSMRAQSSRLFSLLLLRTKRVTAPHTRITCSEPSRSYSSWRCA